MQQLLSIQPHYKASQNDGQVGFATEGYLCFGQLCNIRVFWRFSTIVFVVIHFYTDQN
jgi:hypothetical protein